MIVLCYGLQKSASSFCYQLICDVLEAAGHPQQEFRTGPLQTIPKTTRGGLVSTSWDCFGSLVDLVGKEKWVAVKTHGSMTPKIEALLELGWVKSFASHRNLEDASLSLFEHAQRQREAANPQDMGFAHLENLEQAIDHIAEQAPRMQQWISHPKVKPISYELLRSDPARVCGLISSQLGLNVDISELLKEYSNASRKIENFNKGEPNRFSKIATEAQKRLAAERFGEFAPVG